MRQAMLVVAVMTLLNLGCSFESRPKQDVKKSNEVPAGPVDWISSLEPEFEAIAEDKARVGLLIETGRERAKAKRLRFNDALLLAKLASASNQTDVSAEFYRLAMSLNPASAKSKNLVIQFDMAEMYTRHGVYKPAIEIYKELQDSIMLSESGKAWTWSLLAAALANDNQTEEALEVIQKAIRLEDDPTRRFYEAWFYSRSRRWDEAIQKFDQLMRDFPNEKPIILLSKFSLSDIYVQKGELRKGEEILERVLEESPDNSQVNNDLGYLWADQGKNLEQAEKMIRQAVAAEPDNGAYLDSLGWVLFKMGNYEEAIPVLEQAIQKTEHASQNAIPTWNHLGDAFLKAMKTEKAVEAWQTALKRSEEEPAWNAQAIERIKEKLKVHEPPNNGSP